MPDMLSFEEARQILGPIRVYYRSGYGLRFWYLDGRRSSRPEIILAAWGRLRDKWGVYPGGGQPGPTAA